MAQCPPKYTTGYSGPTSYFDTTIIIKANLWFSVIYETDISLSQFLQCMALFYRAQWRKSFPGLRRLRAFVYF